MFVERLEDKQIVEFLCDVLDCKETDLKLFTIFTMERHKLCTLETYFNNETKLETLPLWDDKIPTGDPKLTIDDCLDWKKYLYKIFGEEYKNWYIDKLTKKFEKIFS